MVLRWGIVSASKICYDFANAFTSYPDNKDQVITSIAARDITRATEFAEKFDIENVYDSYEKMAESDKIDVVYIGSINTTHYELAMLFLGNNKHVLCEKPLCLNTSQTERLVDFANKKNLFLLEAMWCRYLPSYLALEKVLQEETLGDVQFLEANFGIPQHDEERISTKSLGGSTLLDIGTYNLQLAQYVFKVDPIKITATGELNNDGVDVLETIILEYPGEKRAVLNVHGKIKLWNKATIAGTAGLITLEEPFICPPEITYSDGSTEEFHIHESQLPYNYEDRGGLVYQALEAQRCIKQGLTESPRFSHADSIALVKLRDEVRIQIGVVYDVDNDNVCRCQV